MGTRWSPHDGKAQEKYLRGRATAEASAARKQLEDKTPEIAVGDSTAVEL